MSTWQKLGTWVSLFVSVSVKLTVTVSVTCLCWSLAHAEQLLFSCVSAKVSICNYVTCRMSHVKCLYWSLGHGEIFLFSSLCSKLTLTLFHSHSFSLSHSFILSFNHSRHAKQVLFSSLCWKLAVYCWKLQCFFLDSHSTLSCYFRSHRAGSQLKIKILCQKILCCETFLARPGESVKKY